MKPVAELFFGPNFWEAAKRFAFWLVPFVHIHVGAVIGFFKNICAPFFKNLSSFRTTPSTVAHYLC